MTILLLLCMMAPPATPADDIRALLTAQAEAWNRGDLDGFLAPYWNSEGLSFFSNDTVTRGFAATEARYRRRYGNSQETMGHLRYEELEITELSPEAAVVYGRFRLQMKDSNPTGIFTLVLRKESGKWKIIHDHTSTAN
jgi:ketosteroid isomerase-like protein